MSNQKSHTPEPWPEPIERHPSLGYAINSNAIPSIGTFFSFANAQRAVTCVNACKDMENPVEEIAKLRERVKALEGHNVELLKGISALTNQNYHALNKSDGRNDRLLHAVLCAYAKHHLDCPDIGWNELGDILMNVICNEIGDDAFIAWGESIKEGPR